MPQAVGALGAFIATEILLLTGTAAIVAGNVIALGLTIGGGLLLNKFTASQSSRGGASAPSERKFIIRSAVAPRVRSYGRVKVAGTQVFAEGRAGKFYRVLAHNDGEIDAIEEHWLDDNLVTLDGGSNVNEAQYSHNGNKLVYIDFRLGLAAQAHYSALTADIPEWTSAHDGHGIASSLTIFTQSPQDVFLDMFPNAENTIYRQVIRASKVWDFRFPDQSPTDPSTWGWSGNPVLVLLDFLRHRSGFSLPLEWIEPELDAWKAEANVCNEKVDLAAGGTVDRYLCWGTYSYDQRPVDVLEDILATCNGRLMLGKNGGLRPVVGRWIEPTITIDDDAILSYEIASGNEAPDAANLIKATYTSPELGYVETDAVPWEDTASTALYGESVTEAKLYMVPVHSQARRLMKQAAARLNPAWRGTIVANLRALPAIYERFVTITIGELGLEFTAEIDSPEFVLAEGSVVTGIKFGFTAMDAAAFEWNAAAEEGQNPEAPPDTFDGNEVPVPENFDAVNDDRGTYAVAVLTWDALPFDWLKVEVQYRASTDAPNFYPLAVTVPGATSFTTGALILGVTYDFRIRTVGPSGRVSDWTATQSMTASA